MSAMTHEFKLTCPATAARVFAVLTEPAHLMRWFAEHVEIEPRVGGAFRFWGRHTYGTYQREDATQTVLALEPSRRLVFNWRVEGIESEVHIDLSPGETEGTTQLQGRHYFPEPPRVARARHMVDDLWRMQLANLLTYLAGKDEVSMVNFTDPSPHIELSVMIDAPRESVFQALTDPAVMNEWLSMEGMPSNMVCDPRPGGAYGYGWKYEIEGREVTGGPTRILEFIPNRKLVTDWPDWRGLPEGQVTTVTWLLDDVDGRTQVTLIHEGFPRAVDAGDYGYGWMEFANQLRQVVEKRASKPA